MGRSVVQMGRPLFAANLVTERTCWLADRLT